MNWSVEQKSMLGAMGYQLLVRASVTAAPAAAMVEPASATSGAATSLFPELRQALRRAAGDQDISSLIGDLERLRREPALKRALWPSLRALRRSH
jgi:hypothetical protein